MQIEIDGKPVEAKSGSMIIEAADALGVWIPRFCYHRKLSIAANCRMCLVDVEKSPKPLPACATPITEGMKIWTRSPKALNAQKSVMEFLLINHPLDCPICDQGGECELQDISMGYGGDKSHYQEGKRVVKDKDLGPLISSDMTRCIQCTRCVRFGAEIDGLPELGATGRGEHLEIGTFIERNIESQVSGNVIELCPVGALTSKPYRFTARGWELTQRESISPHDCIGSNLYLHTRQDKVMRVVPRENESINEIWISDRDRFSYEGLYQNRLLYPKIKKGRHLEQVTWSEALDFVQEKLNSIIQKHGAKSIGALISPNATIEECYLFQKWLKSLDVHNIDHRLQQADFRDEEKLNHYPYLGTTLLALQNQSFVLLVGSDIHSDLPILGLKLRSLTLSGGIVSVINPVDFRFNFDIAEKSIVPSGNLVMGLARVAKALLETTSAKIPHGAMDWLQAVQIDDKDKIIAKRFMDAGPKASILLGPLSLCHPEASTLRALSAFISNITGAKEGTLTIAANAAGACIAGCLPHRLSAGKVNPKRGFNMQEMLASKLKAYVLMDVEPHLDCIEGGKLLKALFDADFVLAFSAFESDVYNDIADVLLPIAAFAENEGSFMNVEGRVQSFKAATLTKAETRLAWKVLRELGALFNKDDFAFIDIEEVLAELQQEINAGNFMSDKISDFECPTTPILAHTASLVRLPCIPPFATDSLLRRATALQKTHHAHQPLVRMNARTAEKLKLKEGDGINIGPQEKQMLVMHLDERLPDNTVMLPLFTKETAFLNAPYRELTLC